MHLDPAKSIIAALGGLTAVATVTGTSLVTVQRWRMSTARGGTGGFIPRKYHAALLRHAEQNGVELTPASFIENLATDAVSRTA